MADNKISRTFDNLPLSALMGAPLVAAIEAQGMAAKTMVDYVLATGLDENGLVREISFNMNRSGISSQGRDMEAVQFRTPLLSMIPIPSLLVDELFVEFKVEAKEDMTIEEWKDSEQLAPVIEGKLVAHSNSSRRSESAAHYVISMVARQQELPEGMRRLLEILASNTRQIPASSAGAPDQ